MLFGKQKRSADSAADWERRRLTAMLRIAESHLGDCVRTVIVRKGAAEMYPEGADKQKACAALEEARAAVSCAVATYDDAKDELCRYIDAHRDEMTMRYVDTPDRDHTGHDCVEEAWASFFSENR